MVEASGYIFQDIETLLKSAKEELDVAKTGPAEAHNILKESLTGTFQELEKICSRYKDDAEASGIRNKLAEFLEELDSGKLTPEVEAKHLDKIIEQVHHLVEWRKLSTATGRDLSLKSRRRTREDVQKR
ncbi:MAG TPA: hypothetical protein HA349_02480 [Methanotrichaceae archaeon]|nr:hypothetical protein [Methanotrichaceae archaeon]